MKAIDHINRAVAYFGSNPECEGFNVKITDGKTKFDIEWHDRGRRFWVDASGIDKERPIRVFNPTNNRSYVNYILISVLDIDIEKCVYIGETKN